MALAFPDIDPVAFRLGPLAIRWYALAYLAALTSGWRYVRWMVSRPPRAMSLLQVDDLLLWATLGVILGGRIGYVLFYNPLHYLANPLQIGALWSGGMSFHGGAAGVIVALALFAKRNRLSFLAIGDLICVAEPIGQFFGRIANFVNGELWGRPAPADLPWAVVFPRADLLPRHPSQLYQAGLEGFLLFVVMALLWRRESLRMRNGFLSGAFLVGYGVCRIVAEFFREPDPQLGFLVGGATMGQLLSLPLLVVGGWLMIRARPRQ
jgi:phosphatidylglycerol:prolipoprotein diacylglycerol transferase